MTYEEEREQFIPFAAQYADEVMGERPKGSPPEWNNRWSVIYLRRMDELWKNYVRIKTQVDITTA